MRVVVTGASGNIGTALLRRFGADDNVERITGIARRPPAVAAAAYDRTGWRSLDVAAADAAHDLTAAFRGADAVVHLAWHIVGAHERATQKRINRTGSRQVVEAVLRCGVPQLVHLSSAAVYSPAPAGVAVAETWPRRGVGTSPYSRDKVAVEDLLDEVEAAHPELRVVRIRPPAVIQPAAAGALVRMMLGRLAPLARLTGGRLPVLPLPARAMVQLVAADDVAALIGAALTARAAGAFNVADDPVLPPAVLARLLGGRHVPAPAWVARGLLQAGWLARLVPLDGSWLDLLLGCPLVDTTRARAELGWRPRHDARLTLADVRRAAGARGSGIGSPALRWSTLGAGRAGPQR